MIDIEPVVAKLPLQARFMVAGAIWRISTNCRNILEIFQDEFQAPGGDCAETELNLCFYVNLDLPHRAREIRPHFRALEHLYFCTFGPGDSILVDQRGRRVVGSLSLPTACDVNYWKCVILPCLVGIASACVGVVPLHCACVVNDDLGLLIHGESGTGKSTLALSLSLNGFSYLSDDCTYLSDSRGGLRCWGSPAPLKLLPDAVGYFPQLAGMVPRESLNGELAFEVHPTEVFGVVRKASCEPNWLVFMERTQATTAEFRAISGAEAARHLASDLEILPTCIAEQRDQQLEVIDRLVQRECWVLRHGLAPHPVAIALAEFCSH